jgi:Ion channel
MRVMLFCGMSCNFGKNARSVSSSKRLKRRRENLSNRRRANIAHPKGQNAPPIVQTTLSMPKPAFSKLVAWIDGMHGFPANSSGTPWRMLYLSAATITTLGLGDILPVSDKVRLLVGLESFLGVVLIGLFLNSLSSEIQRNRKP